MYMFYSFKFYDFFDLCEWLRWEFIIILVESWNYYCGVKDYSEELKYFNIGVLRIEKVFILIF